MSCDFYRQFELGEIDEARFARHRTDCPSCQTYYNQDKRLLQMVQDSTPPVEAPLLWAKIETTLRAEQQRRRRLHTFFATDGRMLLRAAAVLVLAILVGAYFLQRPETADSGLLVEAALRKVENKESEYTKAIADLEHVALPKLSTLDGELVALYRERLETIDTQIQHCREALADNPANAHIRRYLLAALQDKKQTLQEIVIEEKAGL